MTNEEIEKLKNEVGLQISEQEYRDLKYPSYSLLSDIAKVGIENVDPNFRNKEIGDFDGVIFGKIVDGLVTENKLPEDIVVIQKKPSGKAKDLIKILVSNLKFLPEPKDLLNEKNHEVIFKACDAIKYLKDNTKRIAGLENYTQYITELTNAKPDTTIVTKYIFEEAKRCSKILLAQYPFLTGKTNLRIIPQVKLLGNVNGIDVKGMLDFILINDELKEIIAYDLKTGSYNFSDFEQKGYLGWNYYIQCSLYYELLKSELSKHPIYKDYKLNEVFNFMYIGRFEKKPGTYMITKSRLDVGFDGFISAIFNETKNYVAKNFKGVNELLNEYKEKFLDS